MTARHKRQQSVLLQILCIVLLLVLLAVILISEMARKAAVWQQEVATEVSIDLSLKGLATVFRSEYVVESQDNGPVLDLQSDGMAVSENDIVATVYADITNTNTRAKAAELTAEIERLQRIDSGITPDYYGAYGALMATLSAGNAQVPYGTAETVQQALELRAAKQQERAEREARVQALREELLALIEAAPDARSVARAPVGGVFYRHVDGYEALCTPDSIETLTTGGLHALLATPQNVSPAVGKVLCADRWYLVLPTKEDISSFEVQAEYDIRVPRLGETFSATLVRVTEPDAEGESLLIFSVPEAISSVKFERSEQVVITHTTYRGLRIPMVALRHEGEEYCVYVEENGYTKRRLIEPVLFENGYCLSARVENVTYLQAGDVIVVTPRRLYEGKVLH